MLLHGVYHRIVCPLVFKATSQQFGVTPFHSRNCKLLQLSGSLTTPLLLPQTYYKLNYVDRRVDNPEQRMCEDIPNLAEGLGDLLREWCNASIDAVFYAWMLRRYSRTNKYTLAILGYVLGAGIVTTAVSPNFGRLYKRQSENEGTSLLTAQSWNYLGKDPKPQAFFNGIFFERPLGIML